MVSAELGADVGVLGEAAIGVLREAAISVLGEAVIGVLGEDCGEDWEDWEDWEAAVAHMREMADDGSTVGSIGGSSIVIHTGETGSVRDRRTCSTSRRRGDCGSLLVPVVLAAPLVPQPLAPQRHGEAAKQSSASPAMSSMSSSSSCGNTSRLMFSLKFVSFVGFIVSSIARIVCDPS
jgi:hypothetical protein